MILRTSAATFSWLFVALDVPPPYLSIREAGWWGGVGHASKGGKARPAGGSGDADTPTPAAQL